MEVWNKPKKGREAMLKSLGTTAVEFDTILQQALLAMNQHVGQLACKK
jgi:hypothetical protein